MKQKKCNDCLTKFSITKTIGLCVTFAGFAFGIGKVYHRFEVTENKVAQVEKEAKETNKKLDFIIVNLKLESNPNVALKTAIDTSDFVIAQLDEEEKKKRLAQHEYSLDKYIEVE